jgi:hypothetical protein
MIHAQEVSHERQWLVRTYHNFDRTTLNKLDHPIVVEQKNFSIPKSSVNFVFLSKHNSKPVSTFVVIIPSKDI